MFEAGFKLPAALYSKNRNQFHSLEAFYSEAAASLKFALMSYEPAFWQLSALCFCDAWHMHSLWIYYSCRNVSYFNEFVVKPC